MCEKLVFVSVLDMHGDLYTVNLHNISSILWGFCFHMRDMVILTHGEKIYLDHKSESSYRLAQACGMDLDQLIEEEEKNGG